MDNYPKPGYRNNSIKLIETERFNLFLENHTLENGTSHDYSIVKGPNWVSLVPITENNEFIMIWQYRPAWERSSLEFPAGRLNYAEEEIFEAANRELQEETGFKANKLTQIGSFRPVTWTNQSCYYFKAENLINSKLPEDAQEDLMVIKIKPSEFWSYVDNKSIIDKTTITGYLLWNQSISELE